VQEQENRLSRGHTDGNEIDKILCGTLAPLRPLQYRCVVMTLLVSIGDDQNSVSAFELSSVLEQRFLSDASRT
jgi:hypothetical protein